MFIMDQQQPYGAPAGSDKSNCLQLARTVNGSQQSAYSIAIQWDSNTGLFGAFLLNNDGCSTIPNNDNSVPLSPFIYTMNSKVPKFFTGLVPSAPDSSLLSNFNIPPNTKGFYEVNFNYGIQYGQGTTKNGTLSNSTRLFSRILNSPGCQIASPDPSWFTDFGDNRIRSAIVQITNNLDISIDSSDPNNIQKKYNDLLNYIGPTDGLVVKYFPDIGVLHLYAESGLTVKNWLSTLSFVIWQRGPDSPTLQPSDPPRQFTFSLGEGLTHSPTGPPQNNYGAATHYYFAVNLENSKSFDDMNSYAQSFCYPSFASDNKILGQSAATKTQLCDSGSYPRLTGYLPIIITEGENNFIKNTVFKMVYPESLHAPLGSGIFTNNSSPTNGKAWLGGSYDGTVFSWISGYELTSSHGIFANSDLTPASYPSSAGYYYISGQPSNALFPSYLYFDIATGNWNTSDSTVPKEFAIIEFGDNVNASGNNNMMDETQLNLNLKLTQKITLDPSSFFNSCRLTRPISP